jgi:hypothetical protein
MGSREAGEMGDLEVLTVDFNGHETRRKSITLDKERFYQPRGLPEGGNGRRQDNEFLPERVVRPMNRVGQLEPWCGASSTVTIANLPADARIDTDNGCHQSHPWAGTECHKDGVSNSLTKVLNS